MKWDDYQQEIGQDKDFQEAREDLKLAFEFGDAILRARIEKGWSQTELARRVGTKQANISRIEAGLGNPTLSVVKKICEALEVEVLFVLGYEEASGFKYQKLDYSNQFQTAEKGKP